MKCKIQPSALGIGGVCNRTLTRCMKHGLRARIIVMLPRAELWRKMCIFELQRGDSSINN